MTRTRFLQSVSIGISAALLCFLFAPLAHAGEWNERTRVTFSGPVEVSGHVLPAGTYSFQILNNPSEHNIVEIFNKNRTRLDAIVMAESAYRVQPTGRSVFTLAERPSDSPPALNKWFYPGRLYGLKFVYPHVNLRVTEAKVRKTLPAQG